MPDRDKCIELGFPELAHIPVLFSSKWKVLEEANNYLRARAKGRWSRDKGAGNEYALAKKPSENSMNAYGRDLENFLTYCERFRLDWKKVSYDQILETYQRDMQSGKYSAEGCPLSPSTINRRVETSGDFLSYAAYHGLRDPFAVIQQRISAHLQNDPNTKGSRHRPVTSRRVGKVRQDPEDLRLPTRDEIKIWLDSIHAEHSGNHGKTLYLMCRTVIEVGLRGEENLLLRANQIPDPKQIAPDKNNVRVEIIYGTKGGRQIGDVEKKGKSRKVLFKRNFLFLLDNYKKGPRKHALEVFKEKNKGQPLPKELFLSPSTGKPYSHRRFNEIWSRDGSSNREKTMPFAGWSPHLGRHAWACYEVLEQLEAELAVKKEEARLAGFIDKTPSFEMVDILARDLIDQLIRPALGHVSPQTTEIYLRWLKDQIGHNQYTREWSHWLDGDPK